VVLFLFNEIIVDLGSPEEQLARSACPITISALAHVTKGELLLLVREAIFQNPSFASAHPDKAAALAAMILVKMGANAALSVRPATAQSAYDVPVRLADVSLRVLGDLAALNSQGRLTPQAIDRAVWASEEASSSAA